VLKPFSPRAQAWEPNALELRRIAGAAPAEKLDPWALAVRIGLMVVDGEEAMKHLTRDEQAFLRGDARSSWSGGVYARAFPDGKRLCILNPAHSARRNKITLMEEVAHIHLRHVPSTLLLTADGLQVRDFVKAQEEEAYGVGAAALIPWVTLFPALDGGRTFDELAESYEVTRELVEYRVKITGAFRLYRARQSATARQ
jgi:hypothetical protein